MQKITSVLFLVLLCSCSGASLKTVWQDERGYSERDVDAAMEKSDYYFNALTAVHTNRFDSAPLQAEKNRLRAIFCNCIKKLGDRCRQKTKNLTASEYDLWVKANAIDMAYSRRETSFDSGGTQVIDPDECTL